MGRLELVASRDAQPEPPAPVPSLVAAWAEATAALPADWSDVLCELELDSSADVNRAAILCAPLNPIQPTGHDHSAFRFRSASTRGYGTAAVMVGRCLARLDEAEIRGRVRIVQALSDVEPVATQGALLLVGRRPA